MCENIYFRRKQQRRQTRIQLQTTCFSLICFFFISSFQAQISYESAFPNLEFNFPVEIQNSNDGTDRIFVVEQSGRIKVFPNDPLANTSDVDTFLDVSNIIAYSPGLELGLLGLAFHPNFSQNGYFYIYYTDNGPTGFEMRLARYEVSSTNINQANPSSELLIFRFAKNQSESNHNGGKIAFGPDGYLYASIGDGGGGGDPQGNAQNLNNAFGSILRIDVDIDGNNPIESNPDQPDGNYEIPGDNPRVGQSGLDELYAWGIRNTWKFSFDPASNRLWGADVGQGVYEEINLIENGQNYGWNRFEATRIEDASTTLITTPDIKPIYFYDHSQGDVSITGGYVYRGSITDPLLQGKYVFGDYVSGRVWSLDYDESTSTASSTLLFRTNGQFVSSFGLDESGELYFSDYGSAAKLYKLTGDTNGGTNTPVPGVGQWYNLGNGINGTVETVAVSDSDDIFIGGDFTSAGAISANDLAIYNLTTGYTSFGSGTNGKVNSIAINSLGHVFVGGDFTQISGIAANNIAVWDGTIWSSLGTGTNGPVSKIGIDSSDNIFVGGAFETAGGVTVNNIAQWSNDTWIALTDSNNSISGTNNEIRSIAFDENNTLYVGGNFDLAGGNSAPRIATWDGINWSTLGLGTSGFVQAIKVTPEYVYAGGNFAIAGTQTVNRIARWDRSLQSWEGLGEGLSGNVLTLAQNGEFLYVGGSFETASDDGTVNKIVNNIARWSNSQGWEALGTDTNVGVSTLVNSLEFTNDGTNLYAGGNFSNAGLINTSNIARWNDVDCSLTPITPEYQVNSGAWNTGESEIQVTEGSMLSLSTLESDSNFEIILPNSTVVTGNYTISNIMQSDEGLYTFILSNGCTSSLNIIVTPIPDDDGDGVNNSIDQCPNTPSGETVDANGCSQSQLDDDNDGVNNSIDQCPDTPSGETVDANGCSQSQLDDDNDGVNNSIDQCPNTTAGATVDQFGCEAGQTDGDNDGVTNDIDLCPITPAGESVDANGCSQSQLDDDGDGVNNNEDDCPNTPDGVPVDTNGCPQGISNSNFVVSLTSLSCPNSNDGVILITAQESYSYNASVSSGSYNVSFDFTNTLTISDLEAGNYTICLTVQEFPEYQNCLVASIKEPAELSVDSFFDPNTNILSLELAGATEYTIKINEEEYQTRESVFSIALKSKVNTLEIRTDKNCQSTYEETIILPDTMIVYPNPFDDFLNIEVNGQDSGIFEISFFTTDGKLLSTSNYDGRNGRINLNISILQSGLYILKIKNNNTSKVFNIFKK